MRILLLHPPLLAPAVFSRLAPLLRAAGHEVAVPDLRGAITTRPVNGWWQRAARTAATSMPDAQVVLAHSGAGAVVAPLAHHLLHLEAVVLVASTPSLPEALYDVDVPASSGWEPVSRSYLRLSPAYEAEAQQAAARGWRVERHEGSHLDVLARPADVAATIAALLSAVTRAGEDRRDQREVFARAKARGGSLSLTEAVEAVHAGRREV